MQGQIPACGGPSRPSPGPRGTAQRLAEPALIRNRCPQITMRHGAMIAGSRRRLNAWREAVRRVMSPEQDSWLKLRSVGCTPRPAEIRSRVFCPPFHRKTRGCSSNLVPQPSFSCSEEILKSSPSSITTASSKKENGLWRAALEDQHFTGRR
jgi:hypothetical protein